jgi:prevent-host-death family protein
MTTVTATYAKNNFGEMIDRVISTKKKILVKRAGRPAVYVTPVLNDFEMNLSANEFDKLEEGMKEFRNSFKFSF